MNERIQELVEQAKCCEDGVNWIIDQEKFAELIILECASQCTHQEDIDCIEKHFGIE